MNVKKIFAVIASAFLLASPVASAVHVTTVESSAITRITCGNAVGTAFHVGDGVYVTAAHVVERCKQTAPIVVIDEALDYAILRGPMIDAKLKTSCARFREGESYLAIGYANGGFDQFNLPWIASAFTVNDYRAFTGEAIPGMSGGPVLDSRGRVHGLVNMRWPARARELADTILCKRL